MVQTKKKVRPIQLILVHAFLLILVAMVLFLPKQRPTVRAPGAMIAALCVIELLFGGKLLAARKKGEPVSGICDIMLLIWFILIIWELLTSVLHVAHPVLIPAPENVFDTFWELWRQMLLNVWYSLRLLAAGFLSGMVLAVVLGLFAGWVPRLRAVAYPIANVLAPIPAVVFSPYLVSLMPSFRMASVLVILLGVFWPAFLTTINRVTSIEPRILDSARMLNLGTGAMVWRILLPYVLPGIVSGLRVSVTTSLLMLNFAELMGATHGMGYFIQNSITYANYTHAVAGIICIGVVVTLLNRGVTWIQTHGIRWR